MDPIYLDHSATTPVLPAVWEAMRPYFLDEAGNPASSHAAGRRARRALEDARDRIAHLLDAHPDEVLFTSGATEANNLAIFGLCTAPGTIVTSAIEHPCVLEPVRQLTGQGFTHVQLPVRADGVVCLEFASSLLDGAAASENPKAVLSHRTPQEGDIRLVAVMLANHETGALQPVERLAADFVERAPFHCDAAAAAGKVAISFRRLGVTSLTLSAHKFHGPKGIGALLLKKAVKLRPLLWGGHQQHGKRPGTEAVPLAVGMATALDLAMRDLEVHQASVRRMRERFLTRLRAEAAPLVVNGPESGGIANVLNVSFPGIRADVLLMNLDLAGVACSTGSACSSGSLLPSPVLRAMAVPEPVLHSAMRFSFSPHARDTDAEEAVNRIANVVNRLRQSSSYESVD